MKTKYIKAFKLYYLQKNKEAARKYVESQTWDEKYNEIFSRWF